MPKVAKQPENLNEIQKHKHTPKLWNYIKTMMMTIAEECSRN